MGVPLDGPDLNTPQTVQGAPWTIRRTYMPAISRRRFLRDASLGAAAVGTVAVVGPSALGLTTASSAAAAPLASRAVASPEHGAASSRSAGPEVMAHVVDRSSGTIAIYSGTRKVTFQDRAVAEALLKALQ